MLFIIWQSKLVIFQLFLLYFEFEQTVFSTGSLVYKNIKLCFERRYSKSLQIQEVCALFSSGYLTGSVHRFALSQ